MKPVVIELTDVKTKEKVEELEVDACLVATGRAPYTHVSLTLLSLSGIVQETVLFDCASLAEPIRKSQWANQLALFFPSALTQASVTPV